MNDPAGYRLNWSSHSPNLHVLWLSKESNAPALCRMFHINCDEATGPALTYQLLNSYSPLVLAMRGYDLMSATMQNRWMTLQEVADYLQLSKDMIYRLAQNGRIPASKVGSRWRFKQERIDRWMEDMAVDTSTSGRGDDV